MDDLNNKGPQDRSRISLIEEWEIKWWTRSLGVSAKELTNAVLNVGNSANKVKDYLKMNKKGNLL